MNFKIANGSTKDIVVGSGIKIKPDFIPKQFNSSTIFLVTKIESGYPFVNFDREEEWVDDNGDLQTMIYEESAVSPELITGVV